VSKPHVGFLGVGWIGRNRMEAILADGAVEAVAVADPSPDCVAAASALAPQAQVVDGLDQMLALGLDGVVIASPSALHAGQTLQALRAGAAVFCQKPLGRTADEVHEVHEVSRKSDRLLMVDLSYRYTAAAVAVRDLIGSGAIGRVRAVDLTFHNAYGPDKPWFYDPALSGGGCVMDLGVHLIDLALWTLGWPQVEEVEAQLLCGDAPAQRDQCEDYAIATLRLSGGTLVRLACSWRLQAGREAVIGADFFGSAGGAALRNVAGSFYDFTAERFCGTTSEKLASPPDAWGGRAAVDWARRLAGGERYTPEAARFEDVARVLDRIYGR
jgi:predicted dehydrogenase